MILQIIKNLNDMDDLILYIIMDEEYINIFEF